MKRTWILALGVALFAPIGFVGCGGEESKVKTQTTIETPGGTKTESIEKKVETTGDQKTP